MKTRNIAILVIVLLMLALPVMAQEESPVELPTTPDSTEPIPVPSWVEEIAFASVLVTTLVGIAKLIPFKPLQDIPAPRLALVLNMLLWVAYRFLVEMGADTQLFISYISNLGNISSSVLNIVMTYFVAAGVYHGAKKANMPVLGVSKIAEAKG